ncbi:alpha/beta fold hydrolase [Coxiella endosymbiont of Ornithodoros maritimus]|uniref:alpha/beta fold hydrolase n=1 Tax=Coxiella endosymbiont of Ornithodoros maritimus TaxID=1656172 RepID=UPI00389936BD
MLKNKILLIHGLFGAKGQWYKMVLTLCQRRFNVVAPDLAGYSRIWEKPGLSS